MHRTKKVLWAFLKSVLALQIDDSLIAVRLLNADKLDKWVIKDVEVITVVGRARHPKNEISALVELSKTDIKVCHVLRRMINLVEVVIARKNAYFWMHNHLKNNVGYAKQSEDAAKECFWLVTNF